MTPRRILALLALGTLVLSSLTSCARSDRSWHAPQPVRLESSEEWASFLPSWVGWTSGGPEGLSGGLLLRDGDWIGGDSVSLVYLTSDGNVLRPTREPWGTLLGGKLVSLSLKEGQGGREWLEKAAAADLAGIRLVDLPDELDAAAVKALQRLAAASPNAALSVGSTPTLVQVLPLFKPRFLALDDTLGNDARAVLANQSRLETLVISGKEAGSLDLLPMLPGLRRLAISDWDVEKAGPLPPGLHELKTLVAAGAQLKDLSALRAAPLGLQEVSFSLCDELADVSGLANLPGLKTVILTGSKKVVDLSPLKGLQLRWLGLPPKISQEQFASVVTAHPALQVLEMVQCENVTDLSPLRGLKHLESLVLPGDYKSFEVIRDLRSLRFVGLDPKAFKDSASQVAALKKALPDAMVVATKPMCLGSGFILLLLPAVALLRLLRSRRREGGAPSPQRA